MGIFAVLISLILLMLLAYRGISVLLLAPLMASLAVLLSGDGGLLLPIYTDTFMRALGNYVIQFFPLFLLGADGAVRIVAEGLKFPNGMALSADGGTLYLMAQEGRALGFAILRNDTLGIAMGGTTGNEITFYPVHLRGKDGQRLLRPATLPDLTERLLQLLAGGRGRAATTRVSWCRRAIRRSVRRAASARGAAGPGRSPIQEPLGSAAARARRLM